ncbi:MAG TPA: hypothetical protein VII56_21980 [Rhizomicrobium sp.]
MRRGVLAAAIGLALAGPALADSTNPPALATPQPAACATSAPRTGKPLPGGDDLIPVVLSSTVAAEAAVAPHGKPAPPIAWCLDAAVPNGGRTISVWHDPADPASARVTAGTGGFEVRAFQDTAAPALLKDRPGVTIYDVILVQGDKLQVVGFFDGPPPIDAMVTFFVKDRFGVYADIDLKTHQVTIYRPF